MGSSPFKKRCYGIQTEMKYVSMNPNPKNFRLEKVVEFENTYAEVFYPDAKNYEGYKVLVYKGRVARDLLAATELDPHFSETGLSPIARFKPDFYGKWLAMQIAKGLQDD